MKGRAGTAIFWTSLEIASDQVLSLLIFLVMARMLPPQEYGAFWLGTAILGTSSIIFYQGLAEALIQGSDIKEVHVNTIYWVNIALALVITSALILSADFFAVVFKSPELAPALRWLALTIPLRALVSVQSALLRRDLKTRYFAKRTIIAHVTGGTVAIILGLAGYGIWALVAAQLIQSIINLIVLWTAVVWKPALQFSRRAFQDVWRFGTNFSAANPLIALGERTDVLVIGLFSDAATVGYYSLSLRLVQTVATLTLTPVRSLIVPILSPLAKSPPEFERSYVTILVRGHFIVVPIFACLSIITPQVLPIAFGSKWDGAIPMLQAMSCGALVFSLVYFTGQVLSALGQPGLFGRLAVLQVVTLATLMLIAIQIGPLAIGLAYALNVALLAPVHIYMVKKVSGIHAGELLKRIGYVSLAGCLMASVMIFMINVIDVTESWRGWRAACAILIGSTAYILVLDRLLVPGYVREFLNAAVRSLLEARRGYGSTQG